MKVVENFYYVYAHACLFCFVLLIEEVKVFDNMLEKFLRLFYYYQKNLKSNLGNNAGNF